MPAAEAVEPRNDHDNVFIGAFPKNSREIVRVAVNVWKGKNLINCRVWYLQDGNYHPGREGFAIAPTSIDLLMELLTRAREEAVRRGWLKAV